MENRQTLFNITSTNKVADNQSDLRSKINTTILKKYRWRLFIDGSDQLHTDDPYYYDKQRSNGTHEPGYHDSMQGAFTAMLQTLHAPLSLPLIVKLHDLTISGVTFTSGSTAVERMGIRTRHVIFRLDTESTLAGIEDILVNYKELATIKHNVTRVSMANISPTEVYQLIHTKKEVFVRADPITIQTQPFSKEKGQLLKNSVTQKLSKLISAYHHEMSLAKTEKEKILAILRFAHTADLLHPFIDANIRTFVFIIVNKLLLEQGQVLPIFYDPNEFDCLSTDELYERFLSAQRQWLVVAAKEGDLELLEAMLQSGMMHTASDEEKLALFNNAIIEAITNHHKYIVAALIKYVNVQLYIRVGKVLLTPLQYAVLCEDYASIKLLTNAGAAVDAFLHGTNSTPLMMAINENRTKLVACLLECGANLFIQTPQKVSAFQLALDSNNASLINLIFNHLKPTTPLTSIIHQSSLYQSHLDVSSTSSTVENPQYVDKKPKI